MGSLALIKEKKRSSNARLTHEHGEVTLAKETAVIKQMTSAKGNGEFHILFLKISNKQPFKNVSAYILSDLEPPV